MSGTDETLSVAAAAGRLGVSRWAVWQMIAEGELDADTFQRGSRTYTRVQLPEPPEDHPDGTARSRTVKLQEQVDRLTQTVERLSAMLVEAERERTEMFGTLRERFVRPAPPASVEPAEFDPIPQGITARPNPMTHPVEVLPFPRSAPRDEVLEPVRALFKAGAQRRTWWQRLPVLGS